jgi:hypothetical protein
MPIFLIPDPFLQLGEVTPDQSKADKDVSLQKGEALKEWVTQRIEESEALLNSAEDRLRVIRSFENEGQALETLGDNVL